LVYGQQGKFDAGILYIEKLYPISDIFTGNEIETVAIIFAVYADELKQTNRSLSKKNEDKAFELGFSQELSGR